MQPKLLPDIVWNLGFRNNIFLRVYFFQMISQFPSFIRSYTGALIRNPVSFPDCLGSTSVHNWTQWGVISMYNIHSEFSLLQLLFIILRMAVISEKNVFIFCMFIFKKKKLGVNELKWNPGTGNGWVHSHTVRLFHQTELSNEALSSGAKIPPPPPRKVNFILRPSDGLTAGRNRHILFVSVTVNMWFSFHWARIYDGSILKNLLTNPELYMWEKYIFLISGTLLYDLQNGSEKADKLSTRTWRFFAAYLFR